MEIALTILAQLTLSAETEADYETERDELIARLEEMGFSVSISSEDSDDGWFGELEDHEDERDDYYRDSDDEDEDDEDEDEY